MQTRPLWPDFSFLIQKFLCPFSYKICGMCFEVQIEIKYWLKMVQTKALMKYEWLKMKRDAHQ